MEKTWMWTYLKASMVLELGWTIPSDWYMVNIAQKTKGPALTAN